MFASESLNVALPLDCTLGETCYIQQYVDRTPGPGAQDFACGILANDGHRGTDFAVPTEADMARGVRVLAAAPGLVRGIRDGMPDLRQGSDGAPATTGRDCGNGVLIDHGDGWESQYCHLMQGTVRVREGDRVRQGDLLGLVGMSGAASFPHLHFGLRHDGQVVDPFLPDPMASCGQAQGSLWQAPIAYDQGGLIDAGLIDRVPRFEEVKAGLPEDALPGQPEALVLWGFVANGREGDILSFDIAGPDGPFGTHEERLDRTQPFLFRAWGRRAPSAGLKPGEWRGRISHRRGGREIDRIDVRAEIR